MMNNRKNFKKQVVGEIYELQDGMCSKCSRSLDKGFHKHHKDSDSSNRAKGNLELLCPQCHRATYQGDGRANIKLYDKQQKKALKDYNELITKALSEGLSGNSIGSISEAIRAALAVSREAFGMDEPETIDDDDLFDRPDRIPENEINQYIVGFKDGWYRGYNERDIST